MEEKLLIGQKIREKRKRKHMTQFMLAEQVGLHEKQISRIESGLNFPNLLSFLKIISVLGLKLTDFTTDNDNKESYLKDDIIYILRNADETELKIYLDVLKTLKKNFKALKNAVGEGKFKF